MMKFKVSPLVSLFGLLASLAVSNVVTANVCKGDCGQWEGIERQLVRPLAPGIPFEACFEEAAERYDVPQRLLVAIASGESDFNPLAVSSAGAIGVMQIMWPVTARHLGVGNKSRLFDACENIHAGARYFRELLDRYKGNTHHALAAYNMGPERIKQHSIPAHGQRYSDYIYRRYLELDTVKSNPLYLFEVKNGRVADRWIRVLRRQFPTTHFSTQHGSLGQIQVVAHSAGNTAELIRHVNSIFYPES